MKPKDENIGQILDEQMRDLALKDMIKHEYEPFIELNRQLDMIVEDGDWDEETEKDVKDRIDALWKTWYLITIIEKQLEKESDLNRKYALLLKIGIYHQQNENLMELGILIGTYPSETEIRYIKECANEELKIKLIFSSSYI